MRHLVVRETHEGTLLEVEGDFDAVTGHDLRLVVRRAVGAGASRVLLDLSRVLAVDEDGLAALRWCEEYAAGAGAVLSCVSCSRPAASALRRADPAQWAELRGRNAVETSTQTRAQASRNNGSGRPVSNHIATV